MIRAILLAAIAVFAVEGALSARQEGGETTGDTWTTLYRQYGFDGLINSKLNAGVSNLQIADVDGDGRQDLVVVNNPRSRIEFLMQRSGDEKAGFSGKTVSADDSVNELPDEVTFRRDSFATEEQVIAVAIGDVNGDGRSDLVFVGDSNKLSVAPRGEDGRYGPVTRLDLDNVAGTSSALSIADVNGDGRNDAVVLGKESTHIFLQDKEGRLGTPQKLPNAQKDPGALKVTDLNGDRILDLLYVHFGTEWPFRYRLGRGNGAFGPEISSRFAEVRAFALKDVDGDGKDEIAALRRRSGRLAVLKLGERKVEAEHGFRLSSVRVTPYEALKDADRRTELLCDLDGDGRKELVVAEPSAARLVVYADLLGGTAAPRPEPSMNGVANPRLGDLDGDGKPDLLVTAQAEEAIGLCPIDGGRIGFPQPIAIPGGQTIVAVDVADLDGDGRDEAWVALADGKGRKRTWQITRLALGGLEPLSVQLDDLKGDPSDMLLADLNRDGRKDVMLFIPRELPRVLLQNEDGKTFKDLGTKELPGIGILKGVARTAVWPGDVDGDGKTELLVPGPNFVRALYFGADGTPQVVGQYLLASPAAEVVAAGLADLNGDGKQEVIAIDKRGSELVVLAENAGTFAEAARVDIGEMSGAVPAFADFDKNGSIDVLLAARDRFGIIQNGGTDAIYESAFEFDVPIKDAYLFDVALGDVNSDGETDAVFIESAFHLIVVAAIHPRGMEYALKFPVFEQRIFERGEGGGRPEPRELALGDVTGDGKADIAILVHDRVIVYPQE